MFDGQVDRLVQTSVNEFYDREDMSQCLGCFRLYADPAELDDNGLCKDCAADCAEELEYERQIMSDFYSGRL